MNSGHTAGKAGDSILRDSVKSSVDRLAMHLWFAGVGLRS